MKRAIWLIICIALVSTMLLGIASGIVLAAQSAYASRPFQGCYSHGRFWVTAVRSNENTIAVSIQFIADSPNAGRINAQIKVGFDGGAQVIKERGGYYGDPIYLTAHVHGTLDETAGYAMIYVFEWCQGWHYWFYEVRLRPDSQGGVIIWLADEGGSGDFLPV